MNIRTRRSQLSDSSVCPAGQSSDSSLDFGEDENRRRANAKVTRLRNLSDATRTESHDHRPESHGQSPESRVRVVSGEKGNDDKDGERANLSQITHVSTIPFIFTYEQDALYFWTSVALCKSCLAAVLHFLLFVLQTCRARWKALSAPTTSRASGAAAAAAARPSRPRNSSAPRLPSGESG